jgi:hypothetical protein
MIVTQKEVNYQASEPMPTEQFKVGDLSIILDLLSKLYSTPIQTLTQEYICNARDANREVKSTRPITITAPSVLNPVMTIRDYGPGLSEDRLKRVFVNYGVSTKSKDNNMTGGFGIGSKSAWAYTDSFTIISIVDNVKFTYLAHKTSKGATLTKLSSEPVTSENNGVAIQIAVKASDVNAFKDAITRAIYYWEESERPELFNLTMQYFDKKACLELKEDIFITKKLNEGYNNFITVIDGIPYRVAGNIPAPHHSVLHSRCKVIQFLGNGVLKIAPNREDLIYNEENINKLTQYVQKIITLSNSRLKQLEASIKLAFNRNSFSDMKTIAQDMASYFDHNGTNLNGEISFFGDSFSFIQSNTYPFWRYGSKGKMKASRTINIEDLEQFYYRDDKITSQAKANYALKKVPNGTLLETSYTNFQEIKRIFNPKPLSSIDISDYRQNIARASKTAQPDRDVTIHEVRADGSTTVTKLYFDSIVPNRVYVWLEREQFFNENQLCFLKSLPSDLRVCYIAKSHIKSIANNPNFVNLAVFIKDFPINADHIYQLFDNELSGSLQDLKNFLVKNFASLVSDVKKEVKPLTQFKLKEHVVFIEELKTAIRNTAEYKKLQISKGFLELVHTKCPMVKLVNDYTTNANAKVVIDYINTQMKGVTYES